MTETRITLRDLMITDGALPPATISFCPGLNLIIGASDTEKTFVFEAIDFMLGAKKGLRRIPESEGYVQVSLTVDPSEGAPFTLRRGFDGGGFKVTEYGDGRDHPVTATKSLSHVHTLEPDGSLSAYLLDLLGIGNRQVRKNVQGEKKSLTFRHVSHLTLIDEERVIQQSSPVLSEHDTENTAEANAFAYFLTGQDDSAIIPQESSKNRKARLATEASLLETILEERRAELLTFSADPDDLVNQATRLEAAIGEATNAVVSSQREIATLAARRAELFDDRTKLNSRLLFLDEQLKRLRLLDDYYRTDRARLESVIEASRAFHDLPEGTCPLCNQTYPAQLGNVPPHASFESACAKEIEKIDALGHDLAGAIADFDSEEREDRERLRDIAGQLRDVDGQLHEVLLPASGAAQADLQGLVQKRTTVARGVTLQTNIRNLEDHLDRIRKAQTERIPKPVFEPRATTSSASDFCTVVEELLRAWKYPDIGTVAFDTDKSDLVIRGKDRANTGKGYRAITYAAFAIGLMKYCRQKGIPHPGFVVLDTPVNPYKGPTVSEAADKLTDEVKAAFFQYLADDESGDQVIVMENEDPPQEVRGCVNYHCFTRNPALGRYGFFPLPPFDSADDSASTSGEASSGDHE